jgi:hypothetical protein
LWCGGCGLRGGAGCHHHPAVCCGTDVGGKQGHGVSEGGVCMAGREAACAPKAARSVTQFTQVVIHTQSVT